MKTAATLDLPATPHAAPEIPRGNGHPGQWQEVQGVFCLLDRPAPGALMKLGWSPGPSLKEGLSPALLCFEPDSLFWLVATCRSKGAFTKVWVRGRKSFSCLTSGWLVTPPCISKPDPSIILESDQSD